MGHYIDDVFKDIHKKGIRIGVWDIETTDFKANFGHMLMFGMKYLGSDEVLYDRIDRTPGYGKTPESYVDDRQVVENCIETINSCDLLVHHYGDRFDLRFVNTRALEHGLAPPKPILTIDTWKVAKYNLAMTSNRLATLAESLADPENQKGGLSKEQWKLASHGHKATLDAMLDYCIQDVLSTEEVFFKLIPFMKNLPQLALQSQRGKVLDDQSETYTCGVCGSTHTQRRGTYRTKCYVSRKFQCQSCGTWGTGKRVRVV